ncbi:MAG: putative bifunctional diguanylate cyclase/phosphodiesterase [Geminicoccaceae bacterium]
MSWQENLRTECQRTRSLSIGRDGIFLFLWVLSSALVVAIAVALTWQAATHLLRHEVQADAHSWVDHLKRHADDLDGILTSGADSSASLDGLRSAGEFDAVSFYRLYDRNGRPVYQSEALNGRLPFGLEADNHRSGQALEDALASDRPIVRLSEAAGGAHSIPSVYGRIFLPLTTKNGTQGTAEIYLDQTAKAERYREAFMAFITGLAVLILFAMALPMTMVWRKTKQRELAERRLHDMAHTDPLTRLSNRTHFRKRLGECLQQAGEGEPATALFWLDLDRFKTINDALGHPIGDALLCQVATRLKRNLGARDTVARLGGDEFALLQTGCSSEAEAAKLAECLIRELAVPFDVEGRHVVIGVSIGIVFAPRDGDGVDDLLKKADIALYRAKDLGRSTFCFFRPDMEARSAVRHALEEDLRLAINNNALRLHYQPQVSLRSGRIVGFEALLRWHHPRFGHMPPDEVIALAEETGLIMPLGFWALKQATADATTWPEDVSVSVNISAVQFRHTNLVDLVGDALDMSGLTPDRLDLEITESILMADSRTTVTKLKKLRRLGVHLSMDDFGTGYSSLNRLRHLPFDRLKVDRSFVRELGGNRDDAAVVRAIVTLGRSLGMQVIAEGVETDAQLAQLHLENCDIAQGYFFGRPVPATEIGRQLGQYNPHGSFGIHAPREARPRVPSTIGGEPASGAAIYREAVG